MAKTDAIRQAEYRRRHLADENGQGERLSMVISIHAKRALERLAVCYGVTQRAMIERVLLEAEQIAVDQAGQHAVDYYDKRKHHVA